MNRIEKAAAVALTAIVLWVMVAFPTLEPVECLRSGPWHLTAVTIAGEAAIAAAYCWMPVRLIVYWLRLRARPMVQLLVLYGAFIVLCGAGHALKISLFWHPLYWISAKLNVVTGAVSLAVAYVTHVNGDKIVALGDQSARLQAALDAARGLAARLEAQAKELIGARESADRRAAQAEESAAQAKASAESEAQVKVDLRKACRDLEAKSIELGQANAQLETQAQDLVSAREAASSRAVQAEHVAEERGEEVGKLQAYIDLVDRQRMAIAALSTPIIELAEHVLLVPLMGILDSERASNMTERIAESVEKYKARVVIVDLTGIEFVDTAVGGAIVRTAYVIKTLGSRCLLSGIRPSVAQTIVGIGIDLGSVQTFLSARQALAAVMVGK